MGYVLKAVLSSAQHPEYGQITVPFPIPDEKYDRMIELLEPLEIGDALRQDCRVDELDSFYIRCSARTAMHRSIGCGRLQMPSKKVAQRRSMSRYRRTEWN